MVQLTHEWANLILADICLILYDESFQLQLFCITDRNLYSLHAGLTNFSITGLGPSFTLSTIELHEFPVFLSYLDECSGYLIKERQQSPWMIVFLAELNNSVCYLPSVVQSLC